MRALRRASFKVSSSFRSVSFVLQLLEAQERLGGLGELLDDAIHREHLELEGERRLCSYVNTLYELDVAQLTGIEAVVFRGGTAILVLVTNLEL